MKVSLFVGLGALAVGVAIGAGPDAVWSVYRQAYPADPAKRWALNQCIGHDPSFDRLNQAAREVCYRHNPVALGAGVAASAASLHVHPVGENFVDLWRSAGQGALPLKDIRVEQRVAR